MRRKYPDITYVDVEHLLTNKSAFALKNSPKRNGVIFEDKLHTALFLNDGTTIDELKVKSQELRDLKTYLDLEINGREDDQARFDTTSSMAKPYKFVNIVHKDKILSPATFALFGMLHLNNENLTLYYI